MLAESLRAFGGRYANLPFFAVKPRAGPSVSRATRRALDRLGVTFVDKPLNVELAWWDHANKPAAMTYAEEHASTPCVTWMDGDMVVLQEPFGFAPPPGANFVARPGEAFDVASNGDDDRADYWNRLCHMTGLEFNTFPIVTSFPDRKTIRAYWQTGIYSYHTSTRFARKHLEIMASMLASNVASRMAGTYHTDQVSASLAVQALGLRHGEYDPRMNFNVNPLDRAWADHLPIQEIRILHYHGSLGPHAYDWLRSVLKPLPLDRLEFVDRYAPLPELPMGVRIQRKLYSIARSRKLRDLERRVVPF